MSTLYKIQNDLALILQDIEHNGGEITPKQEAALDALNLSRDEKLANWVRYLRNLDAQEAALHAEIDQLSEKLDAVWKRQDQSKGRLSAILSEGGELKTWTDGVFKLSWRKSERIEPLMPVEQMREVFVRVTEKRELDKVIAKEHIKANGGIPEARLVEHWNLQVK